MTRRNIVRSEPAIVGYRVRLTARVEGPAWHDDSTVHATLPIAQQHVNTMREWFGYSVGVRISAVWQNTVTWEEAP